MRTVAIALALFLLPLATPALAQNQHDECKDLFDRKPCHEIPVESPVTQVKSTRYYLYLGWTNCPTHMPPDCMGKPNDNRVLPMTVAGTLYEETNKYPGLQRFELRLDQSTVYAPDRMILI